MLYRIQGDPEHPFSEVVGMLQRVATDEQDLRSFHICRRDGSVTVVAEADVVGMKFLPAGKPRMPKSWS